MTNILEEFGWVSLKQRRKVSRHILLCKGLKRRACIPTNDIIPPNMTNKNQHPLAFQMSYARADKNVTSSYIPNTIQDLNSLQPSLLS